MENYQHADRAGVEYFPTQPVQQGGAYSFSHDDPFLSRAGMSRSAAAHSTVAEHSDVGHGGLSQARPGEAAEPILSLQTEQPPAVSPLDSAAIHGSPVSSGAPGAIVRSEMAAQQPGADVAISQRGDGVGGNSPEHSVRRSARVAASDGGEARLGASGSGDAAPQQDSSAENNDCEQVNKPAAKGAASKVQVQPPFLS